MQFPPRKGCPASAVLKTSLCQVEPEIGVLFPKRDRWMGCQPCLGWSTKKIFLTTKKIRCSGLLLW